MSPEGMPVNSVSQPPTQIQSNHKEQEPSACLPTLHAEIEEEKVKLWVRHTVRNLCSQDVNVVELIWQEVDHNMPQTCVSLKTHTLIAHSLQFT